MQSSLRSSYECVRQFSETDFLEALKKMTVLTLIIHGDDDQIVPTAPTAPTAPTVPIAPSAMAAAKILKNFRLEIYKGGLHAMPQMNKDKLNADFLAFLKQA